MAGRYSGTAPTGAESAAWTRVMVAMEDASPASLRREWSDACPCEVRITSDDLAVRDVDVFFTDVLNVTEGSQHRELSWEDLRVENGVFGGVSREGGMGKVTAFFLGCSPAPVIRKWAASSAGTVSREPSERNDQRSSPDCLGQEEGGSARRDFDCVP